MTDTNNALAKIPSHSAWMRKPVTYETIVGTAQDGQIGARDCFGRLLLVRPTRAQAEDAVAEMKRTGTYLDTAHAAPNEDRTPGNVLTF